MIGIRSAWAGFVMKALPIALGLPMSFDAALGADPLRLERTIPLPGVMGRFDHMTLDQTGKQLWVAALSNDTIEVVDLEKGTQIKSISGAKEPQGVALNGEQDLIYVASGEDGVVRSFDRDFAVVASFQELDDADNVRFDHQSQRLFVGYGRGALAVIDAKTFSRLGDIKLHGHPESFQLEKNGNRIFVNVPSAHHVAVVDAHRQQVVATWPIREAKSNFPMALDESNHRLFVICRKPSRMLVLDTESGKTVASLEVCGDADDVFYDASRRRIYVSGGDGNISVFSQLGSDQYQLEATVPTAEGARTSLFVLETSRLYLAVPSRKNQEAEIRVYFVQP